MREPRRGALDPRLNRAFSQHHRHCIKPQRRRRLRRRRAGEREHAHNLDKSQHLIADHVQPIFIPRGEPSRSAFRSFAERAKRAHRRHKRRAGGYARALARVALIVVTTSTTMCDRDLFWRWRTCLIHNRRRLYLRVHLNRMCASAYSSAVLYLSGLYVCVCVCV